MSNITLGLTNIVASIRQCIRIILETSKGEIPFRPNFGLSAELLLDGQANDVDISYAVIDQLSRYEKRIRVSKVTVQPVATSQKLVTIHYTIIAYKQNDILTLEL
jgi:phage baseplate assembly protein W